jgi:Putative esterase
MRRELQRQIRCSLVLLIISIIARLICIPAYASAGAGPRNSDSLFEVSFPSSVRTSPVTGRMLVTVTTNNESEPRFQAGDWDNQVAPFFAADVSQLKPGATVVIGGDAAAFPFDLNDLPTGDYYVQAILNIYTECHRSDGHNIWVHLDQWEGQQAASSPGNIISDVQRVHIESGKPFDITLKLTKVIPPIKIPADTTWVKHIKFESPLLSKFWGCPIYLGATILLPNGYDEHPKAFYPVIYLQNHFSLDAPFGFDIDAKESHPTYDETISSHKGLNVSEPSRPLRLASEALVMNETAFEFTRAWTSEDFPRLIAVTFQHPTPYYDDSYAVNSANNGPYGDAIMQELIPKVEAQFRIIRQTYARVLTGGSTGGWESLALQTYHPDFFGGTWTFYPDPVDFRRLGMVNIYEEKNFFEGPEKWLHPSHYIQRSSDGQPRITNRQVTQLESVLGSKLRSGGQLAIWQATYGPVGDDGYPKPLWNYATGEIDHSVAIYIREHGYDLRDYLQSNWPKIGPNLAGKLHLFCGDMDNYYLNLAVYLLQDFLVNAQDPAFAGSFQYGRPMKGHGWQPTSNFDLIKTMADQIARNAPDEASTSAWHYH